LRHEKAAAIYAIAVGPNVDLPNLNNITGSPDGSGKVFQMVRQSRVLLKKKI
jgi:hypothetical protein